MYSIKKKLNQPRKRLPLPLMIVAALLVILAIFAILEVTGVTSFVIKRDKTFTTQENKPSRTANSDTKGEDTLPNVNKPGQTNGSEQPQDNKQNDNEPETPTGDLATPTGNFVSNHSPNLDNDPAPNTVQSVCITSSGATCEIVFTKGSEVKTLPAQATDRAGAAYWTWKLQDLGLTEGSWKVEAKAKMGGQTKTATDPIALEVKP